MIDQLKRLAVQALEQNGSRSAADPVHDSDAEAVHEADRYLEDLLDRLFVSEVQTLHGGLKEHITAETAALLKDLKNTVTYETGAIQGDLKTRFEQEDGQGEEDRGLAEDRHLALAQAVVRLQEQSDEIAGALADALGLLREGEQADRERDEATQRAVRAVEEAVGLIRTSIERSEEADRERDETTQRAVEAAKEAVQGVHQTVDSLGEAEVGRDELVQRVTEAVHADVAGIKGALEADVQASLAVITTAVTALSEEEGRRAEAAAAELVRLRRWTLAATLTAAAALVAAVLAIVL